ncbi:MAG: cation:proton antiporter, partial [Sporichthyaceae bacterium]
MPDVSFDNLFLVVLVGALAPLALGFAPRLRLPSVVLELVAGIVLGPAVLGWVEVDLPVQVLSLIGLAFLLFLSGLEIDVRRLKGALLRGAVLGYLVTLALGVPVGLALDAAGWVRSPVLVVIALSATSLGLVVPVLKDSGQADSRVAQSAILAATVADFAAIVLLSLLFSASDGSTRSRLSLLGLFVLLVVVTGVVVSRAGRAMRLGDVLIRLQDTTAEIRVRFAVVLLVAFTALAERVGLESILGAFLAGVVIGVVDRDSSSHPAFRTKLEAIGFGFLIPVFFVSSGARLDLQGLFDQPSALLRVPVFLVALLLMRGLPALLQLRALGRRSTVAVALLQATSLPFIVAAVQIGVELDRISPVTGAAMVSAGLLSVLVFPLVALGLLRQPPEPDGPGAPASPGSDDRGHHVTRTQSGSDWPPVAVVPRVTPVGYRRDPRVDAYLEPLPDWQREIGQHLRELVHEADPDVEETIKRTVQPYFVLQGNVCALLAAKDHVNLFLYDGAIVPDPAGIITDGHDNSTARQIRFHQDGSVDDGALLQMLREIIANNRAG